MFKFKLYKVVGVILVFLIGVGVLRVTFLNSEPSTFERLESAAKAQVLSTLKSPSTATFVGETIIRVGPYEGDELVMICELDSPIPKDGDLIDKKYKPVERELEYYEVNLSVDAQNSYGTPVREDYTCSTNDSFGIPMECLPKEDYFLEKSKICLGLYLELNK